MDKYIKIKGARTHNLKNIDLDLPKNNLITITGLSGSGKSSLAFDTIFAEGQRRYVESLSAYARQFLSMVDKPDVDKIEGLSPAISIEQKSTSHNPRSTVGTVTEIYDYLRLLYARIGEPKCPEHNVSLDAMSASDIYQKLIETVETKTVLILSPIVRQQKGEHIKTIQSFSQQGYSRVRVNNKVHKIRFLNQDLSYASKWPPIWETLAKSEINIGIFGSLQSYPPMVNKNVSFYLPDTFSPAPDAHPKALEVFQKLNLRLAAKNKAVSRKSFQLLGRSLLPDRIQMYLGI